MTLLAGLPASEKEKGVILRCVVMNTIPVGRGGEWCLLVRTIIEVLESEQERSREMQRRAVVDIAREAACNVELQGWVARVLPRRSS